MASNNSIFQLNKTIAKRVQELGYAKYIWKASKGKVYLNDLVERKFDKQVWDKIPQKIKNKINTYYTKNNSKKRTMKYLTFCSIKEMTDKIEELLFDERAEIILTEKGSRINTLKVVSHINAENGSKVNVVKIFSNQKTPRIMNYFVKMNTINHEMYKRFFSKENYDNDSYINLNPMIYVRR